jgi:hypothetical protein
MALGGAIPGVVFDLTGGYAWAVVLAAGFSLAGAAAILLLEPTRQLLIPDWERESEVNHAAEGSRSRVPDVAGAPAGG